MTTSTNTTSTTSEAEFDRLAGAAVASADASSASNIEILGLVHQARTARLSRTVANLTALHGSKSTVVVAAQAAQVDAQTIATRIELVRRQAVAVAPTVTATGWAVWGHVYESPATPLSGYTVFLVDSQKTYQSQYGFATTAADGSFAIVYDGGPAQAAAESSTTTGSPASAIGQTVAPSTPSVPTLFLSITNPKAQLVPAGAQPLALVAGQTLYVDTALAAGKILADLSAEVRKTAQPHTKKKKS